MGSISNSLNGLAYLTQSGGLLSNLPAQVSTAELAKASPQDVVSLSEAAMRTQEVNGLFGSSTSSDRTLTTLPIQSTAANSYDAIPGVSAADVTSATAQEKATINDQALALQQALSLFSGHPAVTGKTGAIG
jgi:hypothetical protein